MTETPRYHHHCSTCVFLGRHEYDGWHFDLYWDDQATMGPTVLARWGDDEPDYSKRAFKTTQQPFFEGWRRAAERGLRVTFKG